MPRAKMGPQAMASRGGRFRGAVALGSHAFFTYLLSCTAMDNNFIHYADSSYFCTDRFHTNLPLFTSMYND